MSKKPSFMCNTILNFYFQHSFADTDNIFKGKTLDIESFSGDSGNIVVVGLIDEDWKKIDPITIFYRKLDNINFEKWVFQDYRVNEGAEPHEEFSILLNQSFGINADDEEDEFRQDTFLSLLTDITWEINSNEDVFYNKDGVLILNKKITKKQKNQINYLVYRNFLYTETPIELPSGNLLGVYEAFDLKDAVDLDKYQVIALGTK